MTPASPGPPSINTTRPMNWSTTARRSTRPPVPARSSGRPAGTGGASSGSTIVARPEANSSGFPEMLGSLAITKTRRWGCSGARYCSATAVTMPTSTTSASFRSAANTARSLRLPRPPDVPSTAVPPSADDTMLRRTNPRESTRIAGRATCAATRSSGASEGSVRQRTTPTLGAGSSHTIDVAARQARQARLASRGVGAPATDLGEELRRGLLHRDGPRRVGMRAQREAHREHLGAHGAVSYTHLRAHETDSYLVCRLL